MSNIVYLIISNFNHISLINLLHFYKLLMNFTQNTLNIYNNYLFKHCNAVVPDFCTPQDSHSVRDKTHFAFVTPEAFCATLNYLHKHKLMPLIFQYNFIANTFGLILFVN